MSMDSDVPFEFDQEPATMASNSSDTITFTAEQILILVEDLIEAYPDQIPKLLNLLQARLDTLSEASL